MKKIPTLFKRVYEDHKVVGITPEITEGMEWVLEGEGTPTIKVDGSCCAIINNEFYKRFDAKKGRKIPEGAIPCCEPDPITGHHPHWVKVDSNNPSDRWFVEAFKNSDAADDLNDGCVIIYETFEAIGPHFQGNPYGLKMDTLYLHGCEEPYPFDRSFEGIRKWLETHNEEGIVFWKYGAPQCKIKRSDFGFEWPVKRGE